MQNDLRLDLQLFADGGSGAAGAGDGDGGTSVATGDPSDAAGRQLLRDRGVPESKLRKNRSYAALATNAADDRQEPTNAEVQDDAGEKTAEELSGKRMTWDEIMADPEYNKAMQETVSQRLKKAKSAEEALGKLAPALEVLARKYKLDPEKLDYDALSNAVNNDEQYYEDKAMEMGTNVETARRVDQMEREQARQQRQQQQSLQEQMVQNHFANLVKQSEALKQTFPSFDLRQELQNPTFVRLTQPGSGLSVEDAYYAIHRNEIQAASMQVAAQKTAEKMSAAIQSGSRRPAENGSGGQATAPAIDYRKMTRQERDDLKARIRAAKARGEVIYPGM